MKLTHLLSTTSALTLCLLGLAACSRDSGSTAPDDQPSDSEVFLDGFSDGMDFQAFGDSKLDALNLDYNVHYAGSASIRIDVPNEGNADGSYAGGAFVAPGYGRNLSSYTALTFYAKASLSTTIAVLGIGNDNTGTSLYTAEQSGVAVGTEWQKYTLPLPLPSKLTSEAGLFHFAAAPHQGSGYQLWFDEIQFETLDTVTNPRPVMDSQTLSTVTGSRLTPTGCQVTFAVEGVDQLMGIMPAYYTYISDNTDVATPVGDGSISIVGTGQAQISASLGSTAVEGSITVLAIDAPTAGPPAPEQPAADVISVFSNAYNCITVDAWSTDWDIADVEDIQLNGDDVKLYTNLTYAGIDFSSSLIDASAMNYLHVDVYSYVPNDFAIKLVDFGADGAYSGGDDSEHELSLSLSSSPAMTSGDWSQLDIPLSYFSSLQSTSHLAQIVLAGGSEILYLDNLYLHAAEEPQAPASPAPTPVLDAAHVISIYSDAYTCITVDTWSADWDQAEFEEVEIDGNPTLHYSELVNAGVEFISLPVDASAMNGFHFDLWTAEPTTGMNFTVKLLDAGADATVGTGDDSEHEITLNSSSATPLVSGNWVRYELRLEDFSGLNSMSHLAQLIFAGDLPTVYLDNLYFHDMAEELDQPFTPAPTPTVSADEVIALFSDAYTEEAVETWSADWPDMADVAEIEIDGNATLRYTNLVYAGIEFTNPTIDISDKSHFHMDIWTPDETTLPTAFTIKLVDFGPDGEWSGGDDVESSVSITAASATPLLTGAWVGIDLDLSEFGALVSRQHLAQMVITSDPNTVYVDNVYFYGTGGTAWTGPESPAPDPAWEASEVISLFSDSYANVTVDTWSAEWDEADVATVQIDGNATKYYTNLTYAGIEFTSQTVDASGMNYFHFCFWTSDATALPNEFMVKLVDFGANGVWGGGDDVEHELLVDASYTIPLATGSWVVFDLPLSEFTNLTTRGHLAQLLFGSDQINSFYLDNVLFHE